MTEQGNENGTLAPAQIAPSKETQAIPHDRQRDPHLPLCACWPCWMPVPTAPNVVSLMDALKRSLATEEARTTEEPAAKAKKPKKRAAGQREMLLPF